jgi:hypothetical protein
MCTFLALGILFISSFAFKEDIVGEWKGSEFKFDQAKGEKMPALEEGGRMMHLNSVMKINANGTYQILNLDGSMNGKGIWKEKGQKLVTTDEKGNVVNYEIEKLSDNTLITSHLVEMETPKGIVAGKIILTYSR